jgi:pimeloyl-ACP methyl ester carboxylesterase
MEPAFARFLSRAANQAYARQPRPFGSTRAKLDMFQGPAFTGYVASTDEDVILCFRGTKLKANSVEAVVSSAKQLVADLDYAQVQCRDGVRVHRGFDEELDAVYPRLPEMVMDHGGGFKRLLVTGHSAGGALATLAARRLWFDAVPVDAAYVFSSPRVGDCRFRDSYPLPLYRFERQDDLIPHVPFPPSITHILEAVSLPFVPLIGAIFPNLLRYTPGEVEYIHAGRLFFFDWDDDLIYAESLSGFFAEVGKEILGRRSLPGIPVPASLINVTRVAQTFDRISECLAVGSFEFLKHHAIRPFAQLLGRLVTELAT